MSMRHYSQKPGARDSGFTLLEVLIALLVLSIGLLGLAALQTVGLRSNQMATMRTTAVQAAYDITDRMRANPQGVESQFYPIAPDATPTTPAADCSVLGNVDPTYERSECIADTDLTEWRADARTLPGGQSQIVRSIDVATGITLHTITVHWDEGRQGIDGTDLANLDCPPVDDSDLRCFRLVYSE